MARVSGMTRGLAAALALAAASPAQAEPIGDAVVGVGLFKQQCSACHQIGEGARNRVGPELNGIYGRRAGSVEGYSYSRALDKMGKQGLTWTLETLDAYVENPKALVPGTKMAYRGLKDETARQNVLAYMRDHSDMPQNIPEAEPTARRSEPVLPPDVLSIVGDVEFGEYLAAECLTCHRRDGADEGIPSVNGWPAEDFVVAMHAYKQKLRPHQVMQMMAGRLADDEIAALAAYFETLGN